MDEYISGNYTSVNTSNSIEKKESLTRDTRTFIYVEAIQSALNNNYVFFGREPARGYDSDAFGNHSFEDLDKGRYERYDGEVSILNIFTWLGLVGVFFYFLIFFKAVTLALSHSKNNYIKIVGFYVLFRWCYAWVEDFNIFSIMNITLWVVVAMCYVCVFYRVLYY